MTTDFHADMYLRLYSEGGFTWAPRTKSFLRCGWAVGIDGYGLRVDSPMCSTGLISYYADRVWSVDHLPGMAIGGWMDKGQVYLDVVRVCATREEAEQLAREHKQLEICNLATGECFKVAHECPFCEEPCWCQLDQGCEHCDEE